MCLSILKVNQGNLNYSNLGSLQRISGVLQYRVEMMKLCLTNSLIFTNTKNLLFYSPLKHAEVTGTRENQHKMRYSSSGFEDSEDDDLNMVLKKTQNLLAQLMFNHYFHITMESSPTLCLLQ